MTHVLHTEKKKKKKIVAINISWSTTPKVVPFEFLILDPARSKDPFLESLFGALVSVSLHLQGGLVILMLQHLPKFLFLFGVAFLIDSCGGVWLDLI